MSNVKNVSPQNGYTTVKQLIDQTKQSGLMLPLMALLEELLEEPLLRETFRASPPIGDDKSHLN